VHGVAISFEPGIAKREGGESRFSVEVSSTLRKEMGDNQIAVACLINTQMAIRGAETSNTSREGIGLGSDGDPAFTLQAAHHHAVAFAQNTRDEVREMPVIGALAAQPGMKQTSYVRQSLQVRRLTPRECERLQGFPDDYSLIPSDTPISKVRREKLDMDYVKYLHRGGRLTFEQCMNAAADGPRYKSLGNSMATPVMHWIGQRIELALAEPWPELIP
jgi:DNA (cytosine-5)-methyltransferase 1